MNAENRKTLALGLVLLVGILAAYSNHFENDFHFDDSHAVVGNIYIQDLRNIPKFFTDARYFSTLPDHQVYQPVTVVTLAIDYWLAGGLKPLYFHILTFFWFLVMLAMMFFIFRRIMDIADKHASNSVFAIVAVACFGLHPAIAETVNYIIQRADIYSTLGVVGGLFLYACFPQWRKKLIYMAPAVLGMLAKAPALIFPVILLLYIFLFELNGSLEWGGDRGTRQGYLKRWTSALKETVPAFGVTAAVGALIWKMTPSTFTPGATSAALYRATQPYVTLRYFKSFFLPTELSADTDWTVVPGVFSTEAVIGALFVIGLLVIAVRVSRRQAWRPISFGILWFILALVPTAITALAEVTNDHRMFFPFIGLALAVVWTLRLALFKQTERLTVRPNLSFGMAIAAVAILIIAGIGTWERNSVWHTDEALWHDVTIKSPKNGRGLMNYGLTQMEKGDYKTALDYFERAQVYTPAYSLLEINLGIANGGLGRDAQAEQHFRRAMALAPNRAESHYFYGRWLKDKGRVSEGIAQLEAAVQDNPSAYDARHLLMQIYSDQGNWTGLKRLAEDTLRLAPNDSTAQQFLNARYTREQDLAAAEQAARDTPTAEGLLALSLLYYQVGKFPECIQAAQRALQMNSDYPEAYNNIAAGYNSLGKWDEGIKAANEAIRLKPDFELAKNNLAYAMSQKLRMSTPNGAPAPPAVAPGGAAPAATPGGPAKTTAGASSSPARVAAAAASPASPVKR